MPGLKDIALNLRKTVSIAGGEYPVRGLTGKEIAGLTAEFPEFAKMLYGAFDRIDSTLMAEQAPACLSKFIAFGLSEPRHTPTSGDIEVADSLPGAVALDFVAAIAELSLPRAVVRPFVSLIADGDGESIGKAPDTR